MIAKAVEGLDQIPEKVLLGINLFMAGFALLAHGGSLALTLGEGSEVPLMIKISIPLSLFFVITCIIGFISKKFKQKILSIQSIILFFGSIYFFYYGLSLIIHGLPEGNFSWGVGIFTFFCVYPVYLIRRTLFKNHVSRIIFIKYAHVAVLIIALSIDISVFAKAATHFVNFQRELYEKHRVK